MANIKNYPLSKLADFLNYAYEKELYERWITLYPHMELGIIEYVSFKQYKEKIVQNTIQKRHQDNMSNQEIVEKMTKVIKIYESQKAGEK